MGWSVYPDGWPETYTASGVEVYQPSTVLSVHDGVLDYYLHDDAHGKPVGADLSPWPGGNEYQTYGAYSFCEKVVPTAGQNLADFCESPCSGRKTPATAGARSRTSLSLTRGPATSCSTVGAPPAARSTRLLTMERVRRVSDQGPGQMGHLGHRAFPVACVHAGVGTGI